MKERVGALVYLQEAANRARNAIAQRLGINTQR
jgi:hypothetical protein